LYIYDYCKKQKFTQAARAFSTEASVTTEQIPPIDVPTGFLADWWGVFWDIYNAKTKDAQASKEAAVQDEVIHFVGNVFILCVLINNALVSRFYKGKKRRGIPATKKF
jgi:hypothetical protein